MDQGPYFNLFRDCRKMRNLRPALKKIWRKLTTRNWFHLTNIEEKHCDAKRWRKQELLRWSRVSQLFLPRIHLKNSQCAVAVSANRQSHCCCVALLCCKGTCQLFSSSFCYHNMIILVISTVLITFRALALRQRTDLTLETSAFKLFTVANPHNQLCW